MSRRPRRRGLCLLVSWMREADRIARQCGGGGHCAELQQAQKRACADLPGDGPRDSFGDLGLPPSPSMKSAQWLRFNGGHKTHHRVIEEIRADIPAGELTLQDMESFNDLPIARGMGDTATGVAEPNFGSSRFFDRE